MEGTAAANPEQGWADAAGAAQDDEQPSQQQPAQNGAQAAAGTQPESAAEKTLQGAQQGDRDAISPQADTSVQQVAEKPVPLVLRPVQTGLKGLLGKISDVLAGRTTPELYEDAEGNKFVYHPEMTRGQQWTKIAGEALVGAAEGLKAGRGGNIGGAAAAGVEAGEKLNQQAQQREREMNQEARQSQIDNANNQMIRMKLAEEQFQATRMQTEATQHDVEFAQGQYDRLIKQGGQYVGTMGHHGDLASVLKVAPELAKDLVQRHLVETVPHYDANGKPAGLDIIKMPVDYRAKILPAGAAFYTWDPTTHQKMLNHASDPMTQGKIDDLDFAAEADAMNFRNQQKQQELNDAKIQQAQSTTEKNNQQSKLVPSEIARNEAEARAAGVKADNATENGPGGKSFDDLVDEVGTANMPVDRFAYMMRSKDGQKLLSAVAKKYPEFNGGKVAGFLRAYDQFLSPKMGSAGGQLNNLGTMMKHLAMLRDLNTNLSHAPFGPAHAAYSTQALQVAHEEAQFYGHVTDTAIKDYYDKLMAVLPGSRAAVYGTLAHAAGEKYNSFQQQWLNSVPSPRYTSLFPDIDPEGRAALLSFDPTYRPLLPQGNARAGMGQQASPAPAAAPAQPPQGAVGTMKFSDGKMHYVNAQRQSLGIVP